MEVRVLVYLEAADESLVWCAESPDVEGFYAADGDLQGLMIRAEAALVDVLAEDLRDDTVDVRWQLVGPPVSEGLDLMDEPTVPYTAVSAARPIVAA